MPLRRVRTFCRHSGEDAVLDPTMSTADIPVSTVPLAPSRSVNGSTSLGKHCWSQERHSPERASKRIVAMTSSTTTPDFSPVERSTPVVSPTHTSIPDTFPPLKRPNLSLNPINDASTNMPESLTSTPTFDCPEPASPAPTEIAYDISPIDQSPDERIEALREAGIKVRDFAYEPIPNSSKAPEYFDPVPYLIAADWHMRNPEKNHGFLSSKALSRLIKMGWLSLTDVKRHFNPYDYATLAHYNDKPDEQRYPFVVASQNKSIPTPSQRVRLRRQAGLATYPDDFPDKLFFGYDPTGYSDDEGEEKGGHPPRASTPLVLAETTSTSTLSVVEAEADAVVVEEPKPKRRKVKDTTKRCSDMKPKPLRRECSRPEA